MAIFYNTGMYSLGEQVRRSVKLAPDCFVEFNNSLGTSIATPVNHEDAQAFQASSSRRTAGFKGGIVSVSTSASLEAGSGSCTLQISSPPYDGLHDSYSIHNPDGTKSSYFRPMMEVKVYAKGRFMTRNGITLPGGSPSTSPRYYVIFWGFVTGINEGFSGGNVTYSLSCKDMLHWWHYQTITIVNSPINSRYNGKPISPIGTLLRFLNPWEIIINMFRETSFENFVYPTFNANGQHFAPMGEEQAVDKLARYASEYWSKRFGSAAIAPVGTALEALSQLEMFGFQGKLDLTKAFGEGNSEEMYASRASEQLKAQNADQEKKADGQARSDTDNKILRLTKDMSVESTVTLDFGLVGKVWPYANMVDHMPSTEATNSTKLEIAKAAVANTHLEFFQDANGLFVMKPPFYNMDTSTSPVYRIMSEDIKSINESVETDGIINGLQVFGPTITVASVPQQTGFHYDFGSIARYGLRFSSMTLPYGNNSNQLRQLAVAEMSLANAQQTTATLEIPLRPEIRVGYPVYIDYLDSFYYITSVSHSVNFGATATTSLTLSAKRPKLWKANEPLRGYIYRSRDSYFKDQAKEQDGYNLAVMKDGDREEFLRKYVDGQAQEDMESSMKAEIAADNGTKAITKRDESLTGGVSRSEYEERNSSEGLYGSQVPGIYKLVQSEAYLHGVPKESADAVASATSKKSRRTLNELFTITEDSVPYTDINGYVHIGGFPYGANLSIGADYGIKDLTQLGREGVADPSDVFNMRPGESVPGPTSEEIAAKDKAVGEGKAKEAPPAALEETAAKIFNIDLTTHPASAQDATRVETAPMFKTSRSYESPAFSNVSGSVFKTLVKSDEPYSPFSR